MWLECASPPKLHKFTKLPLRLSGTADLARKKTALWPRSSWWSLRFRDQFSMFTETAMSSVDDHKGKPRGENRHADCVVGSPSTVRGPTFWCRKLFLPVANAWLSFWKHENGCSCHKWSPRPLGCQRKWSKCHTKHIDNNFHDTELWVIVDSEAWNTKTKSGAIEFPQPTALRGCLSCDVGRVVWALNL